MTEDALTPAEEKAVKLTVRLWAEWETATDLRDIRAYVNGAMSPADPERMIRRLQEAKTSADSVIMAAMRLTMLPDASGLEEKRFRQLVDDQWRRMDQKKRSAPAEPAPIRRAPGRVMTAAELNALGVGSIISFIRFGRYALAAQKDDRGHWLSVGSQELHTAPSLIESGSSFDVLVSKPGPRTDAEKAALYAQVAAKALRDSPLGSGPEKFTVRRAGTEIHIAWKDGSGSDDLRRRIESFTVEHGAPKSVLVFNR
ncbi:hypothetical protein ACFRAQ_34790 [Nocardia sp. NPDC056611]|uniref:hypothetical protein n=1 Tax=Nocardia sp. NPDC056611 TaxID=3345877 RepID=UPI00366EAF03